MNAVSPLYGLDRPDELVELELKDASQKEIIEATYKAWLNLTAKQRKKGYDEQGTDFFYNQACRLIQPFKEKVSGEISTKELGFNPNMFHGLYLSAVLNETKTEKLVLSKNDTRSREIGYRLRPGKTLEISKGVRVEWYVGNLAEGGTVINRGEIWGNLGRRASGGVFINYNHVDHTGDFASGGLFVNEGVGFRMAAEASGGIFLNRHHLKDSLGYRAEDGLHINHGLLNGLGFQASGGVFVTTETEKGFLEDSRGQVYGAGPDELDTDPVLRDLVEEIRDAGISPDVPKVKEVARKIDAHVRKNYPRTVA